MAVEIIGHQQQYVVRLVGSLSWADQSLGKGGYCTYQAEEEIPRQIVLHLQTITFGFRNGLVKKLMVNECQR